MRTERGLGRLVGFADGVVAIAITLLILPLVDEAASLDGSVWDFLKENSQQLMLFVISFLVIGRFWMIHHSVYENVTSYTHPLLWWNLLWLLTIVFLPFPTELLGHAASNDAVTHALYVGTMFLSTVTSTVQQKIIIDHPELQAPEVRGTLRLQDAVIAMISMLAAAITSVVFPGVGLLALLLLVLTGPIGSIVDRVRGTKVAA